MNTAMKKKALLAITAILILGTAIGIGVYYSLGFHANNENNSPPEDSHISLIYDDLSPEDLNATQGSSFTVNITMTSYVDMEITVPFENLTLMLYDNQGQLISAPQGGILDYNFSPNQLVLGPYGNGSSILTVSLADDAPEGSYVMQISYGNSEMTNLTSNFFTLTINPKPS